MFQVDSGCIFVVVAFTITSRIQIKGDKEVGNFEEDHEKNLSTLGRYSGQEEATRRRKVERARRVYRFVGRREETDVFLKHEDVAIGTKQCDTSGEPVE